VEAATPKRLWPAILFLFVLAPVTAEVLSGSTPILVLVRNPVLFFLNFPFYGGGALLVREVVRRGHLGWASMLWLGAAYGIFEEGVVLNTWADPWAPPVCAVVKGVATGLCDYSRVGGINLLWAFGLTTYHAVVSITIPILLVELTFPGRAGRLWLRRRGIALCALGEGGVLVFGILLSIADFRAHGQQGPLLHPYLIELAVIAGCGALALTRRRPGVNGATPESRGVARARGARCASRMPGQWLLRLLGFLAITGMILSASVYKGAQLPFWVGLALNGVLVALAGWGVSVWSRRVGWSERQMLALASGVIGFFIFFWDPVLELVGTAGGNPTRGTTVVGLCYLLFLVMLTRRTERRLRLHAGTLAGTMTTPSAT
jgi:hypothetical protein